MVARVGTSAHIARLRATVGHDLLLLPSVFVLPLDPAGRLLLVRHAGHHDGWAVLGGTIEIGESPVEAAVREAVRRSASGSGLCDWLTCSAGPDYKVTYPNGDRTGTGPRTSLRYMRPLWIEGVSAHFIRVNPATIWATASAGHDASSGITSRKQGVHSGVGCSGGSFWPRIQLVGHMFGRAGRRHTLCWWATGACGGSSRVRAGRLSCLRPGATMWPDHGMRSWRCCLRTCAWWPNDRAGLGGSVPASDPVIVARQVSDLVSVITELAAGPCVLAGHSWGGILVQLVAFRRREPRRRPGPGGSRA